MKELTDIRKELDEIDNSIYELFLKRLELASDVAEYKIANNLNVYDKKREDEKLLSISQKSDDPLVGKSMVELFSQIMSISKKKQYRMLADAKKGFKNDFSLLDAFPYNGEEVVYQGEEGAYSQKAVYDFFGDNVNCHHVSGFKDAMQEVANNKSKYAVIPIENSTAGVLSSNYDLILEKGLYIAGEQLGKIEHALLGVEGASIDDINEVYSHPQALMQCEDYIKSHENWKAFEMSNTAVAAIKVHEDNKKNQAAIAGISNAKLHSLVVLDEKIQDIKMNMTRFLILSNEAFYTKDADTVTICYSVADEEGSLYKSLSHFTFNGLNLTHIESRPIKERPWEYRFFVSFIGNLDDEAVINAIRGLAEETTELRILGNY